MSDENVREMWSDAQLDHALATLRSDVDVDGRRLAQARAELVSAGGVDVTEPAGSTTTRPAGRRRVRLPRWAVAASAAAAAAALVAGVLVARSASGPDAHHPRDSQAVESARSAAEQLRAAAARIDPVDRPLRPGQYRYIVDHEWWGTQLDDAPKYYTWLAEGRYETWVPQDQRQEWLWLRGDTGRRKWLRGTEKQARADGVVGDVKWPEEVYRQPCGDWFAKEEGREPCSKKGEWGWPTEEFMASLPRDPDKLLASLRKEFAPPKGYHGPMKETPDKLAMEAIAHFMSVIPVPADLRAAFYRVLAKLPTVRVTEQFANLEGRKGTAFGVADQYQRIDVIIDPKTGRYIGERSVLVAPLHGVKAGTVYSYSAVDTAVVNGIGKRPGH
jgi:hypothetical protein